MRLNYRARTVHVVILVLMGFLEKLDDLVSKDHGDFPGAPDSQVSTYLAAKKQLKFTIDSKALFTSINIINFEPFVFLL